MSDILLTRVNRRTTLAWLATAAAWSSVHNKALAIGTGASKTTRFLPIAKGYGSDPDLLHPHVTWDRAMSAEQLRQCAVLADLILPPSAGAPAPSAVGVADFVDEWVSAPYEQQLKDRPVILDGLAALDAQALRRFKTSWLTCTAAERTQLLDEIAAPTADAARAGQHQFFLRARYLVVGAYYSTEAGWKDIGYVGNVPLTAFPPVAPEVVALLELRLKKLGV